VVVPLGVKKGT
jgi:DNA-binding beta-propeller fold protein YncE